MQARPLTDDERELWDRFASTSPDAWFWHTSLWAAYIKPYAGAAFREDVSFWVMEGADRLAIVPAMVDERDGSVTLSHSLLPLPAPALRPGLSLEKRQQVLTYALEMLWKRADSAGVTAFQLKVPTLAPSVISAPLPQVNPLLRLGGLDIPCPVQVIDLRRDEAELWSEVRHGHQYDITRAKKALTAVVWDSASLTDEAFLGYQRLHAKDAGRVTRPQETFDRMKDWIRAGHGMLVEVRLGHEPVAYALNVIYGRGAYYASAAKDPDHARLPASHLAQWRSIAWLKENGIHFYGTGYQQYGPQWYERPSPKEIGISKFKRGFGGTAAPYFTAEFHKTEAGMREAIASRLERFLSPQAASLTEGA